MTDILDPGRSGTMVHGGQVLTGSGNDLRFIRTAAETDGAFLDGHTDEIRFP